jgi:hypothetical protein
MAMPGTTRDNHVPDELDEDIRAIVADVAAAAGDVNTSVHRGLQSRFARQGPYSPQEASLPQFSQWCLERYLRPLPASPGRTQAASCPVAPAPVALGPVVAAR